MKTIFSVVLATTLLLGASFVTARTLMKGAPEPVRTYICIPDSNGDLVANRCAVVKMVKVTDKEHPLYGRYIWIPDDYPIGTEVSEVK